MLDKVIKEFLNKVSAQNTKISSKIEQLQRQVASVKNSIQAEMKLLVKAEMTDSDTSSINKNLKSLRLELSDLEERITAFNDTKTDPAFKKDDIEQIKAAALKARDERFKEMQKALQEHKNIEKQIDELTNRRDDAWNLYQRLNREKEIDDLEKIAGYIDSRSQRLAWDTRKEFLKTWLNGQNTDSFFEAASQADEGLKYTKFEARSY